MSKELFANFSHEATEVVRFLQSGDLFTCMLQNGRVVHFCPTDTVAFRAWLVANGARDISERDF